MRVVPVLLALLMVLPALSGCFGDDEDPAPDPAVIDDPNGSGNVTDPPPTATPRPTPTTTTGPNPGGNDTQGPGGGDDGDDGDDTSGDTKRPPFALPPPKVRADGRLEVPVRVPVILIGFPDETADALRDRLKPTAFDHRGFTAHQKLPPQNLLDAETPPRNPIVSVAHFDVLTDPALDREFPDVHEAAHLAAYMDGAAIEEWLWTNASRFDLRLDPDVLSLFLFHPGNDLVDSYSYRYDTDQVFTEGVRLFGERYPLLFLDIGAKSDPKAAETTGYQATSYSEPMRTDDEGLLEALEDAVIDGTNMRILQGPLYRPATTTCHAVTLVFASRAVQWTDADPSKTDFAAAWAAYDLPGLHVDVKTLGLPNDDPYLDALTRSGPGEYDALRYWLETNWESYWIPHQGCEPYLGIYVDGDLLDLPGSILVRGAAAYDPQRTARVMLAIQPDLYSGNDFIRYLVSHEMGHLFGLAHPHDRSADGFAANGHWGQVQSVMTYHVTPHVPGAGDRANLLRNRAGAMVFDAMEAGYDDVPEFARAMKHLGRAEWTEAANLMAPFVNR